MTILLDFYIIKYIDIIELTLKKDISSTDRQR